MSISSRSFRSTDLLRRTAALAAVACAGTVGLHAQRVAPVVPVAAPAATEPLVALNLDHPLDLASLAKVDYSSSSSSVDTPVSVEAERLNLAGVPAESLQPPPRRRYGRPRYNDSSHNPDGSNKYAFVAGGGFTLATGNTFHYYNTSYGFQVGAGRNFSKNVSLMLQFDYDRFGLNGRTIGNQEAVYNYGVTSNQFLISGLDANAHVWSFSLNPVYNFYSSEGLGAYVVAGVGFYHKVTNFTVPTTGTGYDPYYGYYQYTANQTIDHYTSNAPGFNAGFGLTYKPSRFAGERLFAEVRYVFVDNQQRFGQSINNINNTNTYNQFPANSNRTTYLPVKAGIRF